MTTKGRYGNEISLFCFSFCLLVILKKWLMSIQRFSPCFVCSRMVPSSTKRVAWVPYLWLYLTAFLWAQMRRNQMSWKPSSCSALWTPPLPSRELSLWYRKRLALHVQPTKLDFFMVVEPIDIHDLQDSRALKFAVLLFKVCKYTTYLAECNKEDYYICRYRYAAY